MMVSAARSRLPASLLLLSLSINTATATPAPIWDRILNTLEQYTSPSWLHPSPQAPLSQSQHEDVEPEAPAAPGTMVTSHLPAFTTTIHASTYSPLPLPKPWEIFYPEDVSDDVTDADGVSADELTKRQCLNSGYGNDGCNNSGNYNCGNSNSGNYNVGDGNSGNYNNGNGNSGNGNNADGSAGNGGNYNNAPGVCGNVVISQNQAYVYPAPSTVVVNVAPVTQVVTVQNPQVYTTYIVYAQPPATTVVYQQPQVVNVVAQETYAPRGCAYWEALGYQCSAAVGGREMRRGWMGLVVGAVGWGVWMVVM